MQPFDVVTIGAATRDLFLKSWKFEETPDANAPEGFDACIPFGAKIDLTDLVMSTGGGATNAAVTFRRFGLNTACVARVGYDEAGALVKHELAQEKVDVEFMQTDHERLTAHSIILLSGTGHRAILAYRSAAEHLSITAIPWTHLASRWIYLTNVSANLDLIGHVFDFAHEHGALVAWNPGNAELKLGRTALEKFLNRTAVLILNREEATLVSERPVSDLKGIFEHLQRYPSRALVVTDGANGAYVHEAGQTFHAPALAAMRVNTTGAGDAFGSGLVAGLALGYSLQDSLRAAMLNATGVVSHMGAKAGILDHAPTKAEMRHVKIEPAKL